MAATVAITVEGVLQQHVGDAVIPSGQNLYAGLQGVVEIALVTDQDPEAVTRWLRLNGFRDYAYLVPREATDPDDTAERRSIQVRRLKALAAEVGMVVDSDPSVIRQQFIDGNAALLFLSPVYSRPEYRPDWDGSVKPWDDLVTEVDRANALRADDSRPTREAL